MDKVIRATLIVEVPYSNELLNYGDKLDAKLKQVVAEAPFLNCKVTAGNLEPTALVIKENI
jgi:hypothetical protein|tara:strand:+ start:804 stop:986 length:183 start_codon:yes stop_codon:yes gene_type:complete